MTDWLISVYLKDSEQCVDNWIKVWGWSSLREIKLTSEELHPEQSEDKDEEEEKKEKGHDRGESIHQSYHQVAQRGPVSIQLK